MSVHQDRGLLATALASVGSLLVEPADSVDVPVGAPGRQADLAPRPVVAVFGLRRGCGSTVVARALAAELAGRDAAGATTVLCEAMPRGLPMPTASASRLARLVEEFPGAACRGIGRLCLVHGVEAAALAEGARHLAPLVLDAGSGAVGGVPAAVADRSVLVTTPELEPALARVAAECLARVGPAPEVVVNRDADAGPAQPPDGAWVRVPESRIGAGLALGGRGPRGELGRAIAELADRCRA